jgi:outer membrane porin, OprD family
VVRSHWFRETDFVKRRAAGLIAILLFAQGVGRASPPEYLAATREPAESASEEVSPIEEPVLPLAGWRLATRSTEPFFRDSIFSLEPRFYYRHLDNGKGLSEAFAGGGALGLTSGWWRGTLQLGIDGYTTQPLATGRDPGGTGLLRPDGDGFSVLGQLWGKLHAGPATATLFRQEMELPFINGDDTRMIPNTFEAYRLDIKPSDVFRFGCAYVTREKSKTSAEFRPMSEVAGVRGVDRGTSVVGFLLGAKDATYIGAINELTWDLLNVAYLEASKTWRLLDDFQLRGEVQFIDQQSVGDELLGSFDTQLYGTSLIASYHSAVLTVAFTSTTNNGLKILRQFGGVPAFNSLMISDFAGASEDAFRVGVSYDFARIGLTGLKGYANYAHGELASNQHEDELDGTFDYRIDHGPLKNLWLRVRYAHNALSNQAATEDFRVILNYTFAF